MANNHADLPSEMLSVIRPEDATPSPSTVNSYAGFLLRQGGYVVQVDGVHWYDYQGFMMPAYLPHCSPAITPSSAAKVVQASGRPFARWDTAFRHVASSEWWYLLKRGPWSLESVRDKKKRWMIRDGRKHFSVRLLTQAEVLSLCPGVAQRAASRYKGVAIVETEVALAKRLDAANVWPGLLEYVGCFYGNQLVSFSENIIQEKAVWLFSLRHDPAFLARHSSYCIIDWILGYYLNEKGLSYVLDGCRRLHHQTAFQEYLASVFGFTREYAILNLAYSGSFRKMVTFAYPFRRAIWTLSGKTHARVAHNAAAVLRQEQISRSCRRQHPVVHPDHQVTRIGRPNEEDFPCVAQLHSESITEGFLSTLGLRFLSNLYRGISKAPSSGVLVARNQTTALGFAAYTANGPACYRWVLARWFIPLIVSAQPHALRFSFWKKSFETLRYLATEPRSRHSLAELLVIAVSKSARGSGIGKRLLAALEAEFRQMNVTEYYVITHAVDVQSNSFYKACGFQLKRSLINHGKPMHEYVRTVTRQQLPRGEIPAPELPALKDDA